MFSTGKRPKTPGRSTTPSSSQAPRSGVKASGDASIIAFKRAAGRTPSKTARQEAPTSEAPTNVALPEDVQSALDQSEGLASGGLDQTTGIAWVIANQQLFLWTLPSSPLPAQSKTLPLPSSFFAPQTSKPVVAIVSHQIGHVAVICAAGAGVGAVYWTNVFGSKTGTVNVDPAVGSPEALPTSLAAVPASEEGSLAIIGCSDGSLWKLSCREGHVSRAELLGQRPGGAPAPVRRVEWLPSDNSSKDPFVLVLTSADVECWSIPLEKGGEEQLAWSFPMWRAVQQSRGSGHERAWLLDMSLHTSAGGSPTLSILAASSTPGDQSQVDTWIDQFTLEQSSPEHLVKIGTKELPQESAAASEEALLETKLHVGGAAEGSFLVLSGDGTCTIYGPGSSSNQPLQLLQSFAPGGQLGPILAACTASQNEKWQLLTQKAGVIVAKPSREENVSETSAASQRRSLAAPLVSERLFSNVLPKGVSLKADTEMVDSSRETKEESETQQAGSEVEEEVPDSKADVQVTKAFIDYTSSGRLEGVIDILQKAGAFDQPGSRNAFARASRSIVDALGKSWTSEGVNRHVIIRGSLGDKQQRHAQFLDFTQKLGAIEDLQRTSALPIILEHSEKLAAALALRDFQNAATDFASQSAQGPFTPSETDPGQATLFIVRKAGVNIARRQVALADRDSVEVLYTRVASLEEFFASLTTHAAAACFLNSSQAPLRLQAERVCELMDASGLSIQAAQRARDAHTSSFGPSTSLPWTSQPSVLDGLWTLCSLSSDVQKRAASSNPPLVPLINQRLRLLGEMLLDGHRQLLEATASEGRQDEILKVYASRRGVLLSGQLEFVRSSAKSQQGDGEAGRLIRREYAYLAAQSKKHGCFEVLAEVCEDLEDDEELRKHMKADVTVASEGPFSRFVFERCLANSETAKLLRFGDLGFGKELGRFLEARPRLRWIHEIGQGDFSEAAPLSASVGTYDLCRSLSGRQSHVGQGDFSDAAATLESVSNYDTSDNLSGAQMRRQLCLEKLARLAGPRTERTKKQVDDLDRRIALLDLQLESGVSTGHPLPPAKLIQELLKGDRSIVPAAFEALSLTGAAFVLNNRALVEQAWLRAASLDDWVAFQRAYVSEGWSDAMYVDELQKTVLYSAAVSLYAQDEGHVMVDALPLKRPGNSEDLSIEAILSKHPSFAKAHEAMLDAVAFGLGGNEGTAGEASTMLVD